MSVNFIHISQDEKDAFPYFDSMASNFPIIKNELEQEDINMIFCKMEIFAQYTNDQITQSNTGELVRCFEFQESEYDNMNDLLLNALSVSYCEALLLGENSSIMKEIQKLMPEKLKKHYLDYQLFYSELCKKSID